MKVLLIDNGTSYLEKIKSLLKDHFVTVVSYNDIPENYNIYDLIILSGGHKIFINKENEQLIHKEIELIKYSNTPIIGICYGSELINVVFGGSIKQINKIKGLRIIHQSIQNPIFDNIKDKLEVFENHSFTVDELSPDLVTLATSDSGVEIYRHKIKPIIGMQFHPEMFTEKATGDEIFLNSIKILTSNLVH